MFKYLRNIHHNDIYRNAFIHIEIKQIHWLNVLVLIRTSCKYLTVKMELYHLFPNELMRAIRKRISAKKMKDDLEVFLIT